MHWLIEDFPEGHASESLVAAVKIAGQSLSRLTLQEWYNPSGYKLDPTTPTLFYGSLHLAQQLQEKAVLTPGPWLNLPAYDCTAYYPAYKEFLFNDNHKIITVRDFQDSENELFQEFSRDGVLFLRPTGVNKAFDAGLVTQNPWKHLPSLAPNLKCVVSTPKNLGGEWRIITDGSNILTGSQYRQNGKLKLSTNIPQHIHKFAEKLIRVGYQPDPVFIMDIVEDGDGQPWLMEIGNFSCSGLYSCDMNPVVERISNILAIPTLDV